MPKFFYNLTYFLAYFSTVERIASKDVKTICKIWLIKLLFFLQSAHFAVFFLAQDGLSALVNLLAANFFYLDESTQEDNIWIVLFFLFAIELADIVYCQNTGISARILKRILVDGRGDGYLLNNKSNHCKSRAKTKKINFKNIKTGSTKTKNRKNDTSFAHYLTLVEMFQFYALLLINGCKLMYVLCGMHALVLNGKCLLYFAGQGLFDSTSGAALVLFAFQPNYLLFVYTAYHLFNVIFLSAILGFLSTWIVYTRLGQVHSLLKRVAPHRFTGHQFTSFLQDNAAYLPVLTDLNRVHGRALFYYILICYPSNASLISIIFGNSKRSILLRLIFVFIAILQMLIIFVCHLSVTRMTDLYHRPVKLLLRVNLLSRDINSKTQGALPVKLKLSHYIGHFQTNRKYGFTYSKYGPITFKTFQRVILDV